MSLYKASKKQRHFQMPLGVLNVGEALIMIFYSGIGFLGYLQYGEHTEDTITGSLPSTPLYDVVQLSYAVVVLGTYPILLYVPIQVLWHIIRRKIGPHLGGDGDKTLSKSQQQQKQQNKHQDCWKLLIVELAFRTVLVLVTCKSSQVHYLLHFSHKNKLKIVNRCVSRDCTEA